MIKLRLHFIKAIYHLIRVQAYNTKLMIDLIKTEFQTQGNIFCVLYTYPGIGSPELARMRLARMTLVRVVT